jgi:hypothetical protein
VVTPLSPRRYAIRVTVDEETHRKLRQLQDLQAHGEQREPAVIVARAIDLLHEKTLAKKAAIVGKPRAQKPAEKRTRDVPAAVQRTVWTRDGGRCAFVDGKGRRCSATAFLEFHHVNNWARGAKHDASEIELRCSSHNQYQAVLDYGAEFIAARRQGRPSRAEEPRRPWVERARLNSCAPPAASSPPACSPPPATRRPRPSGSSSASSASRSRSPTPTAPRGTKTSRQPKPAASSPAPPI